MAKKKKDLKVTEGKEPKPISSFDEWMDQMQKKNTDSYPERFEVIKSRFNLRSQQEEFLSLLGPEKAKEIASARIGNTVHEYIDIEGKRRAAYAVNMGVSFQYQNDQEHVGVKNFKNGTIELFVNLEFKIGGGKRFATKLATLSDCENVNMGMVACQFDREYFDNKRAKVIQNKLTWMNRVIDNACRMGYIEKDGKKIKFYGGKRGIIIKK